LPSPPHREKPAASPAPLNEYEFNFRGDILDKLEDYFVLLDRMRKGDRGAYLMYAKVGANLVPWPEAAIMCDEEWPISEWFKSTLPGFGAVMWTRPRADSKKNMWPRLIYFTKYDVRGAPSELQPVNGGAVYAVTAYWDCPGDKVFDKIKRGVPTEFGICIHPDGSVSSLRMLLSKQIKIKGKRNRRAGGGRGVRNGNTVFTRREWDYPEFFKDWAHDHGLTPEVHLLRLFSAATHSFEVAHYGMLKVTVRKNNKLTATFNIAARRSAYFFKDRDITIDQAGAKKRIFHIVRPHTRQVGDKTTGVRLHFRGLQDFVWNSYAVRITVPGLHHANLAEFDLKAYDEEHWDGKKHMIDHWQVGAMLADQVQEGWPALQRWKDRWKAAGERHRARMTAARSPAIGQGGDNADGPRRPVHHP
jgi:hypothetical protein